MTIAHARLRAGIAMPTTLVLAAVATLIALGTWQIQRKAWKEALIETLDQRLSAAPTPLPPRASWGGLQKLQDEFRHVRFSAQLLPETEAFVFTSGSGLRSDVTGPGYWVFALARSADGSLLAINRGFVPQDRKEAIARSMNQAGGPIDMIGVMRWPEPRSYFSPHGDAGRNLWFVRDHLAIAAARGWHQRGGELAPFFIDLEAPIPPGGWPRPGVLKANLRNEHLQYAITWYGLAVVLIIMFAVWIWGRGHAA